MTAQVPPYTSAPEPLLAVACPSCHAALAVPSDLRGQPARCPLCSGRFLAPRPPAETAAPPADGWPTPSADAAPAEDVGPRPNGELSFAEPVRTIGTGDTMIELRRLTDEERAARRARRNLLTLVAGVSLMMGFVILFGRKKR